MSADVPHIENQDRGSGLEAEVDRLREEVAKLRGQTSDKIRELEGEREALRLAVQQLSGLYQDATKWKRAVVLLPVACVDWMVGSLVLLAEVTGRALHVLAPRTRPIFSTPKRECSFVIVSWNGKDLLAEALPPLLEAIRRDAGNHEVIVVDNGSVDSTSEFIRSNFPSVRLVRSERNLYFGGGNRLGVREATRDILVLLNNDMIVEDEFLGPLLQPFSDPEVFGVASQVFLPAGKRREETGKTRVRFNGCDFDWGHDPISSVDVAEGYAAAFWLHGGAAAMDRRKYAWLGGFDALYDPFYVEDADLSFRAWKVGWKCLLAVNSHVLHRHRSSTKRFGDEFIRIIVRRNQYLFWWKNIRDINLLLKHFLRCFRIRVRHAGIVGVGIRRELKSYGGALRRLPAILKRRIEQARSTVRSDAEILRLTSDPGIDVPRPKPGGEPGIRFSKSSALLDAQRRVD